MNLNIAKNSSAIGSMWNTTYYLLTYLLILIFNFGIGLVFGLALLAVGLVLSHRPGNPAMAFAFVLPKWANLAHLHFCRLSQPGQTSSVVKA